MYCRNFFRKIYFILLFYKTSKYCLGFCKRHWCIWMKEILWMRYAVCIEGNGMKKFIIIVYVCIFMPHVAPWKLFHSREKLNEFPLCNGSIWKEIISSYNAVTKCAECISLEFLIRKGNIKKVAHTILYRIQLCIPHK